MTDLDALRAALEECRHASANPEAAFELADELTKAVKNGLLDDAALGRRIMAGDEALVEAARTNEQSVINRIAEIAEAVALQAGVGGCETAGMIVSYLAENPGRTTHVLAVGIMDEPDLWLNGRLTWHAQDGRIVTPKEARLRKVVRDLGNPALPSRR